MNENIREQLEKIAPDMTEASRRFQARGNNFEKLPDGIYEGFIQEIIGDTVKGNTSNRGRLKIKWTLTAEKVIKSKEKIIDLDVRGKFEYIHRVLRPSQLDDPKETTGEAREVWLSAKQRYDDQTLEMLAMSGLEVQNRTIEEIWNDIPKARGHRVRWTVRTEGGNRGIYLECSADHAPDGEESHLPFEVDNDALVKIGDAAPIGA